MCVVSQKSSRLWQTLVSSSMDCFWNFLGKQHQNTFKNYMHIQLFLSLHFCLLYLLLNSCDGNDAKHNAFSSVYCRWLWKEPVLFQQMFKVMITFRRNWNWNNWEQDTTEYSIRRNNNNNNNNNQYIYKQRHSHAMSQRRWLATAVIFRPSDVSLGFAETWTVKKRTPATRHTAQKYQASKTSIGLAAMSNRCWHA